MLKLIQALYFLTNIIMVVYLFLDFRKHRKLSRHLVRTWILFFGYSIIFPLVIYRLFQNYPEALRRFFPDGPIGPHNVAWLFVAWIMGLVLWVLFPAGLWLCDRISNARAKLTKRSIKMTKREITKP